MQVRGGTPDDYDAYARLMPELGVDDPIPSRERFGEELAARTVIASDGDDVVGYGLYEIMAEAGYVRNLVTDPARRRGGIGRALMEEMRRRFVAAGVREWRLNVFPGNVAAVSLYERCGMRTVYETFIVRVPAEQELAAAPGTELVDLAPDDDDAVERAFGLLRGQLATARGRPSRRAVGLRRDGAVVGVGVFSSNIPGAFPFRVTEPALGPGFVALLRGLVPDARYLQLGVEDDPALRDALLAHGAHVHHEIAHMRGAL